MCKVFDYQNFSNKYKENISFCGSLYLKVLNKSLKVFFSDKSNKDHLEPKAWSFVLITCFQEVAFFKGNKRYNCYQTRC